MDIVSRNGNLLLKILLPASGMPGDRELKILAAIGAWMKVKSAALYTTRPWTIFGEGPGIRKRAPGLGFQRHAGALQREQACRPHGRGNRLHDEGPHTLRVRHGLESGQDTHRRAGSRAAWNGARSRASNYWARRSRCGGSGRRRPAIERLGAGRANTDTALTWGRDFQSPHPVVAALFAIIVRQTVQKIHECLAPQHGARPLPN